MDDWLFLCHTPSPVYSVGVYACGLNFIECLYTSFDVYTGRSRVEKNICDTERHTHSALYLFNYHLSAIYLLLDKRVQRINLIAMISVY